MTRYDSIDTCAGALGLGGSRITFTARECPAGKMISIYGDAVFLGRVITADDGGQRICDPTGRQRDGDQYSALMLRLCAELASGAVAR